VGPVYMWEGTTSRVMAADRPYGEFYGVCRVRPEFFGHTLVSWSPRYALWSRQEVVRILEPSGCRTELIDLGLSSHGSRTSNTERGSLQEFWIGVAGQRMFEYCHGCN
jgi:hypothetical protein